MEESFDVFQYKRAKFRITPNLVVYGLTFILVVLLTGEKVIGIDIPWHHPLLVALLMATAILMLFYSVTSPSKYEPLDGSFYGKLSFKPDRIILNEEIIILKDVELLDFFLGDFYGYIPIGSNKGNFNPVRSHGIRNFVEITLNPNEKQKIYFILKNQNHFKALFPFIENSIKQNKISFLRGIELLEITDYNQIKKFKNKITTTNSSFTSAGL